MNHSCPSCAGHRGCLEHVPIFKGLNQVEMSEIAHIAAARDLQKGEMVYQAGDEGGTLFVLFTGKLKRYRLNESGKEQVIEVIGTGEFIGELSLFSSLPLSDYVEATEDSTLCTLQGQKLKELMSKYPSIAFKVMDELSRRLEKAESRIEAISLTSVTSRVIGALLELAGENGEILLPMTKGDFASQLGMSQETLSRKLSELQEEGLLEMVGHRKILLKEFKRLQEMAIDG